MGKKIFKTDLSVSGIKALQKQLQDYQNDLAKKCEEFVRRLSEIGIKVAETKIGESPLGKYATIKTDITEEQAGCKAILIATGETFEHEGYAPFNTLLAVEFGAGIHYNPVPNPNADKFGLGVGTFPGQVHAFEDYWFYWSDKEQKWLPTHGVRATWPMYSAGLEIQNNIVKIARGVFK